MYTRKSGLAALGSALMLLATLCWPANANPAAKHDFNGDGYSDLAWIDTNGDVVIWLMQGGTAIYQSPSLGNVPGWSLVGEANFLGLPRSQLLWQNNNTRQLVIWTFLCIFGGCSASSVDIGTANANWKIVGSGDFDGDGKADILWRDMQTGQVGIWSNIMTNGTVGSQAIVNAPGDLSWSIVGTGDFNGDGKADILWQNSASNALSIWFMNGTQIVSDAGIGTANPGWLIVNTGDFNGDGMADILWSGPDNQVGVWLMNGATPITQGIVGQGVATGYQIINTGDYNGDGKSDIAFQDFHGDAFIWFMNGTQITSGASIGPVGLNWFMQGPGAFGPLPPLPPPQPRSPAPGTNPGVNLDVNGQICYQVGAYTQPSYLYPLDLPGVNGDTSCNYPFQYIFLHSHWAPNHDYQWWSGSSNAPDTNNWVPTLSNSFAMHASDTLGWQQYFDDNYSFSPRSGSGASIQVVGNNGEGPSALSVGDNGQMGTLVYTVNGSTFYYNCTATNPAQYVIYREVDNTGRTVEQASIEAICQLE